MDKLIPINRQVLRVLCHSRRKDYDELAEELGVTLTDIHNWIEGIEEPRRIDFDNLCDALKVEPSMLTTSSAETIIEGQHLVVLQFYVNQKLGINDNPKITDVRSILTDIQDTAELKSSAEEVKQGEVTIFSAPEPSADPESNDTGSDG